MNDPQTSVIVPVYNEEDAVRINRSVRPPEACLERRSIHHVDVTIRVEIGVGDGHRYTSDVDEDEKVLLKLAWNVNDHHRAVASYQVADGDVEEERRLAYVGITRARERLYLTHAWSRMLHGTTQYNPPSRFLDEIPENLVQSVEGNRRFLLCPGPRPQNRDVLSVGDHPE